MPISGYFGQPGGLVISGNQAPAATPVATQQGTYQSSLSQAQSSYSDVMAGYAALMGQQRSDYGALQGQVQNTLGFGGTPWGVAQPAATAIADTYAAARGRTTQDAISRGLGNTTVLDSLQRGNAYDASKAYGSLGAQLAQTYAGYQSQLGLAGLGAQNQTAMSQLGFMGGRYQEGFGLRPQGGGGSGGGGVSGIPYQGARIRGSDSPYQPYIPRDYGGYDPRFNANPNGTPDLSRYGGGTWDYSQPYGGGYDPAVGGSEGSGMMGAYEANYGGGGDF